MEIPELSAHLNGKVIAVNTRLARTCTSVKIRRKPKQRSMHHFASKRKKWDPLRMDEARPRTIDSRWWIKCTCECHDWIFHWSIFLWSIVEVLLSSVSVAVGNYSRLSKFSRSVVLSFVSPSTCIKLVGTHLVCFGVITSWIALTFTRLLLSVKFGFTATIASHKDLESVACRSSLQPILCIFSQ